MTRPMFARTSAPQDNSLESIPDYVVQAVALIEDAGFHDVWDRDEVEHLCDCFGCHDASVWLHSHKQRYYDVLHTVEAQL